MLPWSDSLLDAVRDEYARPPPTFRETQITKANMDYSLTIANHDDPFDTLHLKKDFATCLEAGTCTIQQRESSLGTIIVFTLPGDKYSPPWNTWWRAVRLLSPKKVRILIFAHPKKRLAPEHGPLDKEHVNGGSTVRCDASTIVVYRKEEATRVLIHELFHANCSDPNLPVAHLEADTEAWAEIVLCAMTAKGNKVSWTTLMNHQILYSVKQFKYSKTHYDVEGPDDYAWRYLVGRLDVWKALGFNIPEASASVIKSLRFTTCEPDNT